MLEIKAVESCEKEVIDRIVSLHMRSFPGFFLSSLHPGFLRQLYKSFITYDQAELLVAKEDGRAVGFLAYSWNTSGVYRYMLWRYFFPFVWYSFLSFIKKPSIIAKLFSALKMPYESSRKIEYVKIFSIGVEPDSQTRGIGTKMLDELKRRVDFNQFDYITLETDADNNDYVNQFYMKNGFKLSKDFTTFEGRRMNKYHYRVYHESSVA